MRTSTSRIHAQALKEKKIARILSAHRIRRISAFEVLETAIYHWARVATQHDLPSRAKYSALRSRGHSHGRALRGVADRLLAVACAMLATKTTYDPAKRNSIGSPQLAAC